MDKKCPNCGSNIPEEASFCLECFSPLNVTSFDIEEESNNSKVIPIIIISVLILVVAVTCVAVKSNNNQKADITTANSIPTAKSTQSVTTKQTTAPSTKITTQKSTVTTATSTTESTTKKESTTEKTTEKTTSSTTDKETTSTTKPTTDKETTSTTKSTTKKKTTAKTEVLFVGNTLQDYPKERKNTSYSIPYNVTNISYNAFNNNKYLKKLKFSKREKLDCDFQNLFASLPNLETVYVYPGTDADLIGLQYFDGEIIYYD